MLARWRNFESASGLTAVLTRWYDFELASGLTLMFDHSHDVKSATEPTRVLTRWSLARQQVRERAISARVTKMITNLEKQLKVIETGLASDPNELNLLKNQMEVEKKLELARFKLSDVVDVKTTAEETMAFSNS